MNIKSQECRNCEEVFFVVKAEWESYRPGGYYGMRKPQLVTVKFCPFCQAVIKELSEGK